MLPCMVLLILIRQCCQDKGIPSVIGIGEALKKDYEGKMVIIDGFDGKLYIEPDQTTMEKMKERKSRIFRK